MKIRYLLLLIASSFLGACSFFTEKEDYIYVARVNNHYLTYDELSKQLMKNLSPEDSSMAARSFIENWATDKLLLDRAKLNLPEDRQNEFRE